MEDETVNRTIKVDSARLQDWFDYVVSVRRLHDTTLSRMGNTVVATQIDAALRTTEAQNHRTTEPQNHRSTEPQEPKQ